MVWDVFGKQMPLALDMPSDRVNDALAVAPVAGMSEEMQQQFFVNASYAYNI
jgi:hypothetical protein